MGVAYFLLMSCLGFAITVQAQNCNQPVPGPNMSLRDQYINQQTFTSGSAVSFSCIVGYQAAGGSSSITCLSGTWSKIMLTCKRKSCGPLQVENGQPQYINGTEFGDKAVITCDPGFTLVGKNQLICEDQDWSGRLPVCEVVICEPPPQIVNGTFSPVKEEYIYRDVVQYNCKHGHTMFGSKSRMCSEDGTFTPDAPTCASVQCEEPPVANADWIRNPPYKPGSTVTIECLSGYVSKEGSTVTLTCDNSGDWSPGLPTCERITTPTTTTTTTTTTSTTTKKPTDDRDGEDESQPSSGVVTGVVVGVILGTIALVTAIIVGKKLKNKKTQGFRRGSPGDAKDEGDQMEEM